MENIEKSNKRLEHRGLTFKLLLVAAAICVVTLGSTLTASAHDPFPPIALTESGLVIGSTTTNGVNEFLGIPYATPPVGALRWTPPKPYGLFPGFLLKATSFGSECTQFDAVTGLLSGSENCLFLNVYTPQNVFAEDLLEDHGRGLPVMVWIHGGGLLDGSSDPYDPTPLVKKGVIVITINYRLGYLGFFAESAIDAEGHLNGNYGLMDQQLALKWVQKNIRGFGGDPDRVTIFGQSAGGESVYAQLASPLAAGLFSGAISESGAAAEFQDYYFFIVTLAAGETTGSEGTPPGDAVASFLGCSTAACLRAIPASTLVSVGPSTLSPFVDGTLLTQQISAAFASGEFNQVPVISGGNHDEWRAQVAAEYDLARVPNPILNSTEYDTAVTALWDGLAPLVLFYYPFTNYTFGGEALGASGTDGVFACPERNSVQLLSKHVPTYAYEFNDENAPPARSDPAFGGLLTFPLGAYHTAELQYLFGSANFFGLPVAPLSPEQVQLSDAMVTYWTQFAKTGNPNSVPEPLWNPYSTSSDEFQSLVPPTPTVESNFDTGHQCSSFWNTF